MMKRLSAGEGYVICLVALILLSIVFYSFMSREFVTVRQYEASRHEFQMIMTAQYKLLQDQVTELRRNLQAFSPVTKKEKPWWKR